MMCIKTETVEKLKKVAMKEGSASYRVASYGEHGPDGNEAFTLTVVMTKL